MKACIDPGHTGINNGYSDPGAVGPFGTKESDITLLMAVEYAKELQTNGIEIILTRTSAMSLGNNEVSDLQVRCDIANRCGADLFVSFHCNSSDNPSAGGTETYCYKFGGQGEKLAHAIQERLNSDVDVPYNLYNRGIKEGNFLVLRNTNMPAVLIESAFISNPHEEKLLNDATFRIKVVRAAAGGTCDYLGIEYIDSETRAKQAAQSVEASQDPIPPQPDMTADEAINVLVNKGIVNSPVYWDSACQVVNNLDLLLIKIAKVLKG